VAKYDDIPDDNHVVRAVPYRALRKDGAGNVIGLEYTAFELRPQINETYLSTAWLELSPGEKLDRLVEIMNDLRKKNLAKPNGALAIGKVSKIKSAFPKRKVRAIHHPKDWNLAYSQVTQTSNEERESLELLAASEWSELFTIAEIEGHEKSRAGKRRS
jgi:hypothetical protein